MAFASLARERASICRSAANVRGLSFEFAIWGRACLKPCSGRYFWCSVASKQHTGLRTKQDRDSALQSRSALSQLASGGTIGARNAPDGGLIVDIEIPLSPRNSRQPNAFS
jgi:hypothetical protein